jgi:hypothetical protein
MRVLILLLLLAAHVPAVAQSTGDSTPAIRLPDPGVGDDAPPSAFIGAARTAIALNRLGEAMEAIERAESRLLVRNVRPSLAGTPSDQALVVQLRAARAALARGARADLLAGVAADPGLDAAPEPSRTGE